MLVLTRKKNQQIRISDEIVITVLSIQGKTAKIGIECPRSIPIHRIQPERLTPCVASPSVVGAELFGQLNLD